MEPASPAVWALVLGGATVLVAAMVLHSNRRERRIVDAAQRLLPNHTTDKEGAGHRFTGRVDGVDITLRLYQRFGEREAAGPWTEVQVEAPRGVSLVVRPKDLIDAGFPGQGPAVDAATGDAGFDSKFVVEVSPAALAPRILDAELRRRLVELEPVRILPLEGGGLRLVKRRWDESTFDELAEAGARLSRNLSAATGGQ